MTSIEWNETCDLKKCHGICEINLFEPNRYNSSWGKKFIYFRKICFLFFLQEWPARDEMKLAKNSNLCTFLYTNIGYRDLALIK